MEKVAGLHLLHLLGLLGCDGLVVRWVLLTVMQHLHLAALWCGLPAKSTGRLGHLRVAAQTLPEGKGEVLVLISHSSVITLRHL